MFARQIQTLSRVRRVLPDNVCVRLQPHLAETDGSLFKDRQFFNGLRFELEVVQEDGVVQGQGGIPLVQGQGLPPKLQPLFLCNTFGLEMRSASFEIVSR